MAFVVALPTSSSTSSLAVGRARPSPPHSAARSAFFGASFVRESRQDARVGRWAQARTRIAQHRVFDVSASAAPALQTAAFILAGAADLFALVALRRAVCSGQPVANAAAAADKTEPAAASDLDLEPDHEVSSEGVSAWLSRVRSSVREIRASATSESLPVFAATPQQASLLVVLSALALGIAGLLLSSPVLWNIGRGAHIFAIELMVMVGLVLFYGGWLFFRRTSAFGSAVDAATSVLAVVVTSAARTALRSSNVLRMLGLWPAGSGVPTVSVFLKFQLALFALTIILLVPGLALMLVAVLASFPFRGEITIRRGDRSPS